MSNSTESPTSARVVSATSVNSSQQSTAVESASVPQASTSGTPSTSAPGEPQKIVPAGSPGLLIEDKLQSLLKSDSAIEALLGRLKKSINTCEEFGKYIRKKAVLEQDHEEHLKKIARTTQEALKNLSSLKNDSFTLNFDKIVKVDERICSHGAAYSEQLFRMSDELNALSATISRRRKSLKENFKRKEKEVIDSINSAEKSKSKYDQLCIELERVKTTDPSKKTFTLKGSRTTSEQEEILQRKIEAADAEYRQKVSTSTGLRNVFITNFRPNTAFQLRDLIIEIDIATSAQLQRYATRTEDLILQNALSVNPLPGSNIQSLKTLASSVDNERDLYQYIIKNVTDSGSKQLTPVEYRQHPSIAPTISTKPARNLSNFNNSLPTGRSISTHNETPFSSSTNSTTFKSSTASNPSNSRSTSLDPTVNATSSVPSPYIGSTSSIASSVMNGPRPMSVINNDNVPLPPGTTAGYKTFGTPIGDLIEFEGEMVPSLVRQCIYVVDKYGLELEGIYRTSGNSATVSSLKDLIDKDPSNIKLILPNPNSITDSDIYAVASLLKQFFSLLPEALLTNEASRLFLEYIKIPEPDVRLKKIHQVIYELPDGSYWTLRSLIFHLSKVSSKQDVNLMNSRNLSIIWGPTLFPKENFNAADMSYQGKVIEELIIHANDIFEAE